MLNLASNSINNWLWRDLYVSATGRLEPSSFFGALFRIAIIYVFGTQVFAVALPSILEMSNYRQVENPFALLAYAKIAAQLLIAWPAWSIFRRRMNDIRPDVREKLSNWAIGFPLFLVLLLGLMVASALGFELPVDDALFGKMRFGFFAMLFAIGLFPGGDHVPQVILKSRRQQQASTLLQEGNREVMQALKGQIARKPDMNAKTVSVKSMPSVIERGRKMPEQGRVKPGWFS